MSGTKKQNPYATPTHANEANADAKSGSVFWTVPGGALGAIIGASLIQRPDELFRGHGLIEMFLMLGMWGFTGMLGSMVWRFPRYLFWGAIKAPWIARLASGMILIVSCVLVLQMGRTRLIDLPEPAMGLTMISLLVVCVVGCVEMEAWYGRRMR